MTLIWFLKSFHCFGFFFHQIIKRLSVLAYVLICTLALHRMVNMTVQSCTYSYLPRRLSAASKYILLTHFSWRSVFTCKSSKTILSHWDTSIILLHKFGTQKTDISKYINALRFTYTVHILFKYVKKKIYIIQKFSTIPVQLYKQTY